jgi:hypothetical protein
MTNQPTLARRPDDAPFFYVSVSQEDESNAEFELNVKGIRDFHLVYFAEAENDEELGVYVYAVYNAIPPHATGDADTLRMCYSLPHLVDAPLFDIDDYDY